MPKCFNQWEIATNFALLSSALCVKLSKWSILFVVCSYCFSSYHPVLQLPPSIVSNATYQAHCASANTKKLGNVFDTTTLTLPLSYITMRYYPPYFGQNCPSSLLRLLPIGNIYNWQRQTRWYNATWSILTHLGFRGCPNTRQRPPTLSSARVYTNFWNRNQCADTQAPTSLLKHDGRWNFEWKGLGHWPNQF